MPKKMRPYIGVIGAGKCSNKMRAVAEEVGKAIAEGGGILVCGGLGGIMEAAAKDAWSKKGITIGILPEISRNDANEYIDFIIPSGICEARNLIVVRSSDVVIALPGKFGTLSEMAFCLKLGKPLASMSARHISDGIEEFSEPVKAVERAFELAEK